MGKINLQQPHFAIRKMEVKAGWHKPSVKSKILKSLSPKDVDELIRMLAAGKTYAQAQVWLKEKHDLTVVQSSLCEFYQRYVTARVLAGKAPPFKPGVKRIVIIMDVEPDTGFFNVTAFQAPAQT